MIKDRFIQMYVARLHDMLSDTKEALATGNHEDLYDVGRLQGQVAGMNRALNLLDTISEELDN